jgi:three-Cys-motif partner protein
MPGRSAIEWTQATWNPVTGCDKVSPGCAHCYAETFAERWRGLPGHPYTQGFDLRLWPERLEYPLKWREPRVIFVNSMSDLFHEDIPVEYIRRVFDVMTRADHHIYQVLTKRHERLAELAPELPWPPHIWMGVTIENRRFVQRADCLRSVPAAVRFISAEPLLGILEGLDLTGIHWVIAGGESGPRHRSVRAEWITYVRDLCLEQEVPFFFKQWGGFRAKSGGRVLEGREWNQMPAHRLGSTIAVTPPGRPSRSRPRDIPDDADEKWNYTEHTRAKHEILTRYLDAWIPILGQREHPLLVLIDGFAGRGKYLKGEPGSPQIMFERAVQAVDHGRAKKIIVRCSERHPVNFEILNGVCGGLHHPRVQVRPKLQEFDDLANDFAAWAEKQRPSPPTFVMVDPYGVRGVKLTTLKRLLAIKRTEVLLTFMVRDPARFLQEPNYEVPMTELFGGTAWRECETALDRASCLMLAFRQAVVGTAAKYVTTFKVFEDSKRVPLYYLVHLTNNDLGMREMKEAMVRRSGDMTFWPISVRPLDQLELDIAELPPYAGLQEHLRTRYSGRRLRFRELLNEDYADGFWIEKHYRSAVRALETQASLVVRRLRTTPSGRPAQGIQLDDMLEFAGVAV